MKEFNYTKLINPNIHRIDGTNWKEKPMNFFWQLHCNCMHLYIFKDSHSHSEGQKINMEIKMTLKQVLVSPLRKKESEFALKT